MSSTDNGTLENLQVRASRILQTMDDTPIAAMDALYYAHYAQELRLIVEELLDQPASVDAAAPGRAWLVCDCADLIGVFDSVHAALEARADLQHRLLCQYGPDIDLLESITVTAVAVNTVQGIRPGCDR